MIVHTSMHPAWRSNTYLVADAPGGTAVFIDAGAPIEPLMAKVAELQVHVTHILITHEHQDHMMHIMSLEERYGATLVLPEGINEGFVVRAGALSFRAMLTPGHCLPHLTWIVQDESGTALAAFTGDTLFRGSVGGTVGGGPDGLEQLRGSIDRILALPSETTIFPGHMEPTTVAKELADNPFVRAWSGEVKPSGTQVRVAGQEAMLLLEGPDYDGGTKVWVRFHDGREAVVGGNMVSRAGVRA